MNAAQCICTPAPAPYDHLQQVHPRCLAHRLDIQLIAAGWERSGDHWYRQGKAGLFTTEQAYDEMVSPAADSVGSPRYG